MEVLASMGTDLTSVTAFLDFLVADVNKGKVSRFFLSQWRILKRGMGKWKIKTKPNLWNKLIIGLFDADVNECNTGEFNCGTGKVCVNTLGSYTCVCPKGTTGPECTISKWQELIEPRARPRVNGEFNLYSIICSEHLLLLSGRFH